MYSSGLLRTAIVASGFIVLTPVALAAPPDGGTVEPAVGTSTPTDLPSASVEAQNCRYKPLSGWSYGVHLRASTRRLKLIPSLRRSRRHFAVRFASRSKGARR